MGIWAAGNFGNDTALDFVDGLSDFSQIDKAISDISGKAGELDVDDACIALAACELLAASLGRAGPDLPDIPVFKEENVSDIDLEAAKSLVHRVRTSSELADLWVEEDNAEWLKVLDDLIIRLTPSEPYTAPEPQNIPEVPDDFLGYCYMCHEMVTERDGFNFDYTEEGSGTISVHPHRLCIEKQKPAPHWNPDGSPNEQTEKKLLRDIGVEIAE